jgi:hypothetical protein
MPAVALVRQSNAPEGMIRELWFHASCRAKHTNTVCALHKWAIDILDGFCMIAKNDSRQRCKGLFARVVGITSD